MEGFRQRYLEEAQDLLQELEKALLVLESHPSDQKAVESAFRVMHTLKGCSSMFGFPKVSEITHFLESYFLDIRDGEFHLNKDLISLTFRSTDHIKKLLEDQDLIEPDNRQEHEALLQQLAGKLKGLEQEKEPEEEKKPVQPKVTFFIFFKPHKEALQFGSNPIYLLDDLAQLGDLECFVSEIDLPMPESLDPQLSYLQWGCLLTTDVSLSEIQDVFLFAEDLCDLKIVELSHQPFKGDLNQTTFKNFANRFTQGVPEEALQDYIDDLRKAVSGPVKEVESKSRKSSIRVASEKLDKLINLVSELVTNQAHLSLIAAEYAIPELQEATEEMEKIAQQLRDTSFEISLIPVGNAVTRFKRLVRDLSHELNKKATLELEGEETELDKKVIENLSDCLVHIFRNSIDHGIEDEETRRKAGKNPEGKIMLKSYNSGANVIIEVQDDGAGIDAEKVYAKALKRGLISKEDKLTQEQIFELLFLSGFSTAKTVTSVSGRGVGMDVVGKKIKELQGNVKIDSQLHKGTKVTLTIPLTISIIDGLMVKVADIDYVIPLSFIGKSYSISRELLESSSNRQLVLDKEPVPYFNLLEEFSDNDFKEPGFAVTLHHENKTVAVLVEEIIGESQAVLQPIGGFFRQQAYISGASLKGDGTVALVLDPQQLIVELNKHNVLI